MLQIAMVLFTTTIYYILILYKCVFTLMHPSFYYSATAREATECVRSARALSRRLLAAPLHVRLLAWPVQMWLLTAVLAITTDYTIILLQFNHVV
ncbi:uncharacterized protein LOC133520970 [Cydia pomonella]|uniref:uncharacterized protein LOC133520970 n=1 Tax=Cydia pomonella TaxID=82600 RepID=UPI002ADD6508|nr:uncharacterized protein LOC133520970 [Cydia pomonella]